MGSPIGLNHRSGERTVRMRSHLELPKDSVGVANFDGYFSGVNPAWTNLLGWTEDEIKSLHVNELRDPDHM